MAEKVLKFPVQKASKPARKKPSINPQTRLFSSWNDGNAHFVIFDMPSLNQEKLSNIIARNGVSSVFDFRSKPIFEKPLFNHREVLGYINRMNIPYYDSAYFTRLNTPTTDVFSSNQLRTALSDGLGSGLVLILLGERLIDGLDKDAVRRIVFDIAPGALEVTSSSVLT